MQFIMLSTPRLASKFVVSILLFITYQVSAQIDANALMGIPKVTSADINTALQTANEGSMLYNTTDKKIYVFDGTRWISQSYSSAVVQPKTANYTLTLSDNGTILTFDSTTDVQLTVPTDLPTGYNISIYQINSGKVILNAATGVTLLNRLSRYKTAGKDAGAGLVCTANNSFHLTGDLKK